MFRHGAYGDVAPKFATLWLVPCSALCPVVCTFAEDFARLKVLRITVHQLFIPTAGYTVKVVKVRLQQLLLRRVSECGRDLYWDGGISTFAVGWNCIAECLQFNCSLWNHLRNGKIQQANTVWHWSAGCSSCSMQHSAPSVPWEVGVGFSHMWDKHSPSQPKSTQCICHLLAIIWTPPTCSP